MRRYGPQFLFALSLLAISITSSAAEMYETFDSSAYQPQYSDDDSQQYSQSYDDVQYAFQDDGRQYQRKKTHRAHHKKDVQAANVYDDGIPTRMPEQIKPYGEKVIVVDPNVHEWGAYSPDGKLLNSGAATAGSDWCSDIGSSCRTKIGSFRIYSLGDSDCYSKKFPVPNGGAPMPYCMFFNGGQAIHGSDEVVSSNASHGCVRVHVDDAAWLRFNFVDGPNKANNFRGTLVVVRPY